MLAIVSPDPGKTEEAGWASGLSGPSSLFDRPSEDCLQAATSSSQAQSRREAGRDRVHPNGPAGLGERHRRTAGRERGREWALRTERSRGCEHGMRMSYRSNVNRSIQRLYGKSRSASHTPPVICMIAQSPEPIKRKRRPDSSENRDDACRYSLRTDGLSIIGQTSARRERKVPTGFIFPREYAEYRRSEPYAGHLKERSSDAYHREMPTMRVPLVAEGGRRGSPSSLPQVLRPAQGPPFDGGPRRRRRHKSGP